MIYTLCELQWVLFANERYDKVACTADVALAATILSSLATLGKYISVAFFSGAVLAVNDTSTGIAVIFSYILKLLQLQLKYVALVVTAYLTFAHINDSCGDPGDHQELSPLIIAVVSLELICSSIETVTKICDICYKCQESDNCTCLKQRNREYDKI